MSIQKAQEEYSWIYLNVVVLQHVREIPPHSLKDAPQGWKSWLPIDQIYLKHLQEQVRAFLSFRVAEREEKRMSEKRWT